MTRPQKNMKTALKYNAHNQPQLTSVQFRGAVAFFMLMAGAEESHMAASDLIVDECYRKGWDPMSTARQALNTVTDGDYERSLRR